MKIAIILPGQPRFTKDFDNFLSNLTGYDQADWFVYITNDNIPTKQGVGIPNGWSKFDPDMAFEKIKSKLPKNNYIQDFRISDVDQHIFPSVDNVYEVHDIMLPFKMFYNIYQADQLRQQNEQMNNFKYDLVIRTRPDVGIGNTLDLSTLHVGKNQIIMPDNNWHTQLSCNDQFAIGDSDTISVYSDLYNRIKEYNSNGVRFHPETMVGHHLNTNGIIVESRGFNINLRQLPLDDF
jgi:hypothetical protein